LDVLELPLDDGLDGLELELEPLAALPELDGELGLEGAVLPDALLLREDLFRSLLEPVPALRLHALMPTARANAVRTAVRVLSIASPQWWMWGLPLPSSAKAMP
jgi:hypothetical protein